MRNDITQLAYLADDLADTYGHDDALECMEEARRMSKAKISKKDAARLVTKAVEAKRPEGYVNRKARRAALREAESVFLKYLGAEYDLGSLRVVLATLAVERLGGEPLWTVLISGSGNAKTETVRAAIDVADVRIVSSIASEGALLSGTSRGERSKDATGGLMHDMGESGTLVIKDGTTMLSMSRDARSAVFAALREIYDGIWSRLVGTDGGRELHWKGRIAVIMAVTTAWDAAHEALAELGPRFLSVRVDSDANAGRRSAGMRAIENTGSEDAMRTELAAAVARVVGNVSPFDDGDIHVTGDEMLYLLNAADLVTRARTAVQRDYRGDVVEAHAPEAPTRFAKQLAQVVRGAVAVGLKRSDAMSLAIRCARDSMPPMLLAIFEDVATHPASATADVQKRLDKPRASVDRALQTLHILGVLSTDSIPMGGGTRWIYTVVSGLDARAIDPDKYREAGALGLDPFTD